MKSTSPLVLLVLVAALGACSKVEPPSATGADSTPAYQSGPVSVVGWGPQSTPPGVVANPLPSGNTGMFFTLSRSIDGVQVQVLFDGQPLKGVVVDGKTVTAELPAAQLAAAGQHAVALKLSSGEAIDVGQFVVAEGKAGASAAPASNPSSDDANAVPPSAPAPTDAAAQPGK